jgi:pyruvate/2-oxoglutarate dehydrogenase complex dihydrolipoamide dehydrogenase (E3) component
MSQLVQLQPYDQFNQELEANVHPPNWVNPKPSGRYNLVVIGAGTAGLVSAIGAAGLGAKVALIERELMGGDCLNVGCVPSKALISAARIAAGVRDADQFGVRVPEGNDVDFPKVMERMRRLRSGISSHDSAKRFRDAGIDVFIGSGRFTDRRTIEVDRQPLRFKKAVVATGARAAELAIAGFADVGVLTNESVFSLTQLPRRLAVIGGGPIGCEMAQCFARFGSEVTQIEKADHILPREESEAALVVQEAMKRDGVRFLLNANTVQMHRRGDEKVVVIMQDGKEQEVVCDEVLAGIGRAPNVEGMGLENAGIQFDLRGGIEVNDRLQTTNRNVYAAGDVASKYKFTHAADFMARIVIQNALFLGRGKVSRLVIPWATYTSPELAHVGVNPQQTSQQGIEIDTYTVQLADVDRAILEEETEGFVRVHVRKGSDRIVGATIVATNAGDLISEITLAMKNGIGLKDIGSTIHPYPTQGEAIRRLGDQFNRTRLTPTVAALMRNWLRWTR